MYQKNNITYLDSWLKLRDFDVVDFLHPLTSSRKPGGGTPYNGLYGEALPERGAFSGFRYIKG